MNEPNMRPSFTSLMTQKETIAAAIYLPMHIVGVPMLINLLPMELLQQLGNATVNAIYYAIGFLVLLVLMHGFLRRDFDTLLDRLPLSITSIISGYFLSFILALALTMILELLGLSQSSTPNNDAVIGIMDLEYNKMYAVTVLLAPFVEEILFRGLLFGAVRNKNRTLAYVVSVLAFSLYHVWQYAVVDLSALIYMLSYIPVSYALAWCYDRSGSIWVPIGLHMLNNAINMSVLRAL